MKSDNASDMSTMEKMIGKYENFLRSYPTGKNKERAINRINQYSYQIAGIYYKDDWKLALKYYNKIYNSIDTQDAKTLFNNIYNKAFYDYKENLAKAKKYNSLSKYSEALNELNNCRLIISTFPKTDLAKETNILESNIYLLNKKISSIMKFNDLEREIREQDKELNNINSSGSGNTYLISARINKFIEPNIYLGKETGTEKIVAIKSENDFKAGQQINLECIARGKISVTDEDNQEKLTQLYIPISEAVENSEGSLTSSERDAIYERLRNLKIQKGKIDSLLKINLL